MAFLPRPVTRMMLATPEASASSTPYWMMGVSTSGSISFGCAFVAGRNLVPSPAAGKTAFRIVLLIDLASPIVASPAYAAKRLRRGLAIARIDCTASGGGRFLLFRLKPEATASDP